MMLQLPFEIATCESTTFSSDIATVALPSLYRHQVGRLQSGSHASPPRQPLLVSYDCSHPTVTLADNGGSSLLISYLSHSPPSRGSTAFLSAKNTHKDFT